MPNQLLTLRPTTDLPILIRSKTFTYTGQQQVFNVPQQQVFNVPTNLLGGVVQVQVRGAGGGFPSNITGGSLGGGSLGTHGDIVNGTIPVTPGEALAVIVGGAGLPGGYNFPSNSLYVGGDGGIGFGNGGNGGSTSNATPLVGTIQELPGAGGGGGSGITRPASNLCEARAHRTTAFTTTGTTHTIIPIDASTGVVDFDTDSGFGSGKWTVPAGCGGEYLIIGQVALQSGGGTDYYMWPTIIKNAATTPVQVLSGMSYSSSGEDVNVNAVRGLVSGTVKLNAGDTISLAVYTSTNDALIDLDGTNNFLSLKLTTPDTRTPLVVAGGGAGQGGTGTSGNSNSAGAGGDAKRNGYLGGGDKGGFGGIAATVSGVGAGGSGSTGTNGTAGIVGSGGPGGTATLQGAGGGGGGGGYFGGGGGEAGGTDAGNVGSSGGGGGGGSSYVDPSVTNVSYATANTGDGIVTIWWAVPNPSSLVTNWAIGYSTSRYSFNDPTADDFASTLAGNPDIAGEYVFAPREPLGELDLGVYFETVTLPAGVQIRAAFLTCVPVWMNSWPAQWDPNPNLEMVLYVVENGFPVGVVCDDMVSTMTSLTDLAPGGVTAGTLSFPTSVSGAASGIVKSLTTPSSTRPLTATDIPNLVGMLIVRGNSPEIRVFNFYLTIEVNDPPSATLSFPYTS